MAMADRTIRSRSVAIFRHGVQPSRAPHGSDPSGIARPCRTHAGPVPAVGPIRPHAPALALLADDPAPQQVVAPVPRAPSGPAGRPAPGRPHDRRPCPASGGGAEAVPAGPAQQVGDRRPVRGPRRVAPCAVLLRHRRRRVERGHRLPDDARRGRRPARRSRRSRRRPLPPHRRAVHRPHGAPRAALAGPPAVHRERVEDRGLVLDLVVRFMAPGERPRRRPPRRAACRSRRTDPRRTRTPGPTSYNVAHPVPCAFRRCTGCRTGCAAVRPTHPGQRVTRVGGNDAGYGRYSDMAMSARSSGATPRR